jgi:spore maturation protein CgeB
MRIYCAVRHANDPKQFYGGLWSGNFYPALRSLGHEVIESTVDLCPTSQFMDKPPAAITPAGYEARARTTEAILDEVAAEHAKAPIGLFLSYFYNSHFDPAGFDRLQSMGIPTINFYCNSMYQFELVAEIAAKVQWSWHAEKPAAAFYKAVGARPVWVQMAADPGVYFPVKDIVRSPDAVFVGQKYADRDRWVAALIQGGVPVELYGPSWASGEPTMAASAPNPPTSGHDRRAVLRIVKQHGLIKGPLRVLAKFRARRYSRSVAPLFQPHARGAVPFTEIARIFSSHEVVLNFSNVYADGEPGSKLIPHVRLRDFEAPMCKTCYITGYTDEITEFYDVGKEIETYKSAEELVDKTKFLLKNPAAAEKLRQAGYERAIRDHTWVRRFQQLFRETGLNEPAPVPAGS